jgi:hypothetical protein
VTAVVVRPRWPRAVGVLWLVAGAALALAGLVVLADQWRLAWELPAGVVVLVVGWWVHHRELVVDEHGIEQAIGFRRSRLQWSVVEHVRLDPDAGAGSAVRLDLHGRGRVVLPTSQGLARHQYDELAEGLRAAAGAAGVPVTEGSPDDG